ncbi:MULTISPECIES: glucosyltransferase domain-containing protein [Enterobacteriaceae]|nr:glucosyltransferase domain-containing protein [Escherichia coli]EFM0018019.1 hypothetical protein [Escherichia coli]EGW1687288.1 hypothetical protein [Escherichia coli]EKK1644593.1 glucosyltransferase domain-containing protein [Escherichia coli]EKU6455249.1 glucosyltransferase domain-containing protein [Escherichia coli]EKX1209013.1 glucosyltransferase domain-containing protein [Escherichia coli]
MNLKKEINANSIKIMVIAFITSLLVYFQNLTNFSISIDTEYAFFSWPNEGILWWISLGRWGSAIIDYIFRVNAYTPGFTTLVMLALNVITAFLLAVNTFKLLSTRIMFAIIFVSFPQFAYQAEFAQQSDTVALGQLLACISGLILYSSIFGKDKVNIKLLFIGVLVLTFSLGIYQSLISFPVVVFLMQFIAKCNEECKKRIIKCFSIFSFAIILATSIYYIIVFLSHAIFNVTTPTYLKDTFHWLKEPVYETLQRVSEVVISTLTGDYYFGASIIPFMVVPVVFLSYSQVINHDKNIIKLISILTLAISPFFVVIGLGGIQGPRVLLGLSATFAFLFAFAIEKLKTCSKVKSTLSALICTIVVYYSASTVNMLFYSDAMAREIDSNITNRILSQLQSKYGNFNPSTDVVSFIGAYPTYNPWKKNNSDTFGESMFSFSGGDPRRITKYAAMISGFSLNLHIASNDEKEKLKLIPSWPDADSITVMNGIYFIKLGD